MRDDLSILIQGPINDLSLNCIPEYSKFASKIIISTWDISIERGEELFKTYSKYCDIKIVSYPQPNHTELINTGVITGVGSDTTFYWQILGVYNGSSVCDTKYIIRTRSDEYFSNLLPLLDLVVENNFKFTCGNIWFKPKLFKPLHIGDHLYFSETSLLNNSLKMIIDVWHKKYTNIGNLSDTFYMGGGGGRLSPEQVLAKSIILNYKKIDINKQSHQLNWTDDVSFKEIFDVIDINKLKPMRWNWSHGGRNGEEFNDNSVIRNINEY